MENDSIRDLITIEDDEGREKHYEVEALFEMEGSSYAFLRSKEEAILMRVEEENGRQFLVGINDQNEKDSILDAYQIAVEASPAE